MAFVVLPGADASGNGNDWTANNINNTDTSSTTYDIMTDVPTLTDEDTANYAVMNPLSKATTVTVSEGNLKASLAVGRGVSGTFGMDTGKWYFEITYTAQTSNALSLGLIESTRLPTISTFTSAGAITYYGGTGNKYVNGVSSPYGATYTIGDIIGIAVDRDGDTLTFYKNNVSQGSITTSGLSGTLLFHCDNGSGGGAQVFSMNFGQRPFAYTPPTGYKKLNTFNLPDSSIVDGSEYFNTVTYTGDGLSTKTIDTYEFSPDLVWVKNRGSTYNHILVDSVRGANHFLKSNETASEGTTPGNQFLSNGFEFESASVAWNQIGVSHVMWGWRGSDSTAVSNTDGTITSSVIC